MDIAVIKTGGKQYVVSEGKTLKVEKLKGQAGDKIKFDQVLLVSDEEGKKTQIGQPVLKMSIEAKIVEQGKSKTVDVVKYKAKTRYKKTYGHRQAYTKVKIEKIGSVSATKATAKK